VAREQAVVLPADRSGRQLTPREDHRVLLVDDDDGDAVLVEQLLQDGDEPWSITRVTTIADAVRMAPAHACALVDLDLPDAGGLDALGRLREAAPTLAIIVLTGVRDRAVGLAAVVAGAQDYLVKGDLHGPRLARAARYSIERRRAEVVAQQLLLAARRQDENERLARGLLPELRLGGRPLDAATRYHPGATAVLGGDFLDAIALADGTIRAVIGDVCGHGPSEAALGVALRIAWRTATIDDRSPHDVLAAVARMLLLEQDDELYATVCDVTISADLRRLSVHRHGHPPPLRLRDRRWTWLDETDPAPPLGVGDHVDAPHAAYDLDDGWALLLVTDGAYEGWDGDHRLGMEGLATSLDTLTAQGLTGDRLLQALALETVSDDGRRHDDDVALLWLSPRR